MGLFQTTDGARKALVIKAEDWGDGGAQDILINAIPLNGDTSRRVRILGGFLGTEDAAAVIEISSGRATDSDDTTVFRGGHTSGGNAVEIPDVAGNPGEDLFIQVPDLSGSHDFNGHIEYILESVPGGLRTSDGTSAYSPPAVETLAGKTVSYDDNAQLVFSPGWFDAHSRRDNSALACRTGANNASGASSVGLEVATHPLFRGDTIVFANHTTRYQLSVPRQTYTSAWPTVAAGTGVYTLSSGTWAALGFNVGDEVTFAGFTNAANNGTFTITSLSSADMTTDNSSSLSETPSSGTVTVIVTEPATIDATGKSYVLSPALTAAVDGSGTPVLATIDGGFGRVEIDVDTNISNSSGATVVTLRLVGMTLPAGAVVKFASHATRYTVSSEQQITPSGDTVSITPNLTEAVDGSSTEVAATVNEGVAYRCHATGELMRVTVSGTSVFGLHFDDSMYASLNRDGGTFTPLLTTLRYRNISGGPNGTAGPWVYGPGDDGDHKFSIDPVLEKFGTVLATDLDPATTYTHEVEFILPPNHNGQTQGLDRMREGIGEMFTGYVLDGLIITPGATVETTNDTRTALNVMVCGDSISSGFLDPFLGGDGQPATGIEARYTIDNDLYNYDSRGTVRSFPHMLAEHAAEREGKRLVKMNNSHGGWWAAETTAIIQFSYETVLLGGVPGLAPSLSTRFDGRLTHLIGTTISDLGVKAQRPLPSGWEPDLIVIYLGINDQAVGSAGGTEFKGTGFRDDLETTINLIKSTFSGVKILFVGPHKPDALIGGSGTDAAARIAEAMGEGYLDADNDADLAYYDATLSDIEDKDVVHIPWTDHNVIYEDAKPILEALMDG